MNTYRKNKYYPMFLGGIIILVSIIAIYKICAGDGAIVFIDDTATDGEDSAELVLKDMKLRHSEEYKSWKHTTDTSFSSLYNGNRAVDVLASRPDMVILWAGYSFSKSYYTPRGHMYTVDDFRQSLRSGAPMGKGEGTQPAACWACKSQDVVLVAEKVGFPAFYQQKWSYWGSEIVNPVACSDCHDPESMDLYITRPFFAEAYQRSGCQLEDASEQEMRSLVCAQCHVEYYFKGDGKYLTFPWDKGFTVEDMEAYYDKEGFADYTHKLSRAPMLKAQHPDFELAQMGIHAQRGVSCGECHMPYMGEDVKQYNNHHIQSPLAMIDQTCRSCHRENEETLYRNVYDRQNKVMEVRNRLEDELTRAHIEAKFAWDRGATEKQMKGVLKLLREAQWRWDFGVASHGAAFHAPQEVQRILGCGLDKAMQARISILKVLVGLGYTGDVPMPDISTKEKAQKYIGLNMAEENMSKEKFLKTVLPEWIEEAKANNRLLKQ